MSFKKTIFYSGMLALALFTGSNKVDACTTIIAGKGTTTDGSTIIARNEDARVSSPKHYLVHLANTDPKHFTSKNAGSSFTMDLPDKQLKYTSYEEWDTTNGIFGESGINELNVGMSATETLFSKPPKEINDPLVAPKKGGIDEDSTLTVVLPYIKTAKEGVERLGKIVETSGAFKTHGTIFSDKNEIWYFEIVSGHNWIAVKVPDDKYAVITNRINIKEVDLDDKENVMMSKDFKKVAELTGKYEKGKKFNVREAFDSAKAEQKETNNAPRVWDGQRLLSPSLVGKSVPTEPVTPFKDFEFFVKPDEKIDIEKIQSVLSSHYNNTEYDTYAKDTKTNLQAISKPSTMESHIIQMRQDKPQATTGIQWVGFGATASSTWVPFFSGITDTPDAYKKGTDTPDFESGYWTFDMTYGLAKNYYGKDRPVTIMNKKDAFEKYINPAKATVLSKMNESIAKVDAEYETKFKETPNLDDKLKDAQKALKKATKAETKAQKAFDKVNKKMTAYADSKKELEEKLNGLSNNQAENKDSQEKLAQAQNDFNLAQSKAEKMVNDLAKEKNLLKENKSSEEMVARKQKFYDEARIARDKAKANLEAIENSQKDTTSKHNQKEQAKLQKQIASLDKKITALQPDKDKKEAALNKAKEATKASQTKYDDLEKQADRAGTQGGTYLNQIGNENAKFAMDTWKEMNKTLLKIACGWNPVN